jgi:hypothetical protein
MLARMYLLAEHLWLLAGYMLLLLALAGEAATETCMDPTEEHQEVLVLQQQ